jgi:hypothetical protein
MIRLWTCLALVTLMVSFAHAAEPGLVACYTFDEDSGDIAKDTSGHGFVGKIIGDTASLSVQRNYSLRFDREGLFFEYGNGTDSNHVVSTHVPKLNEWTHVVMLCESPRYYYYLNGKLAQSGDLGFPLTPAQGSRARQIGGCRRAGCRTGATPTSRRLARRDAMPACTPTRSRACWPSSPT